MLSFSALAPRVSAAACERPPRLPIRIAESLGVAFAANPGSVVITPNEDGCGLKVAGLPLSQIASPDFPHGGNCTPVFQANRSTGLQPVRALSHRLRTGEEIKSFTQHREVPIPISPGFAANSTK